MSNNFFKDWGLSPELTELYDKLFTKHVMTWLEKVKEVPVFQEKVLPFWKKNPEIVQFLSIKDRFKSLKTLKDVVGWIKSLNLSKLLPDAPEQNSSWLGSIAGAAVNYAKAKWADINVIKTVIGRVQDGISFFKNLSKADKQRAKKSFQALFKHAQKNRDILFSEINGLLEFYEKEIHPSFPAIGDLDGIQNALLRMIKYVIGRIFALDQLVETVLADFSTDDKVLAFVIQQVKEVWAERQSILRSALTIDLEGPLITPLINKWSGMLEESSLKSRIHSILSSRRKKAGKRAIEYHDLFLKATYHPRHHDSEKGFDKEFKSNFYKRDGAKRKCEKTNSAFVCAEDPKVMKYTNRMIKFRESLLEKAKRILSDQQKDDKKFAKKLKKLNALDSLQKSKAEDQWNDPEKGIGVFAYLSNKPQLSLKTAIQYVKSNPDSQGKTTKRSRVML
jgi:hypothetical protein